MMRFSALTFCLAAAAASPAGAWGADGHSIVAEIAERRLTPEARTEVAALLGPGVSLASISAWADAVQTVRPETRGWHFVNIPYDAEGYDAARDCAPKAGSCVVDAIARAEEALVNEASSHDARVEALQFLVHFVADVHQPLHCIDRNDAGGSRLEVTFFGQPANLHFVWDVLLIERTTVFWGEYVRLIEERLRGDLGALVNSEGRPLDWANESHRLAKAKAYVIPEDKALGDDYVRAVKGVVDQRLAEAGIRLASALNRIWRRKDAR
ncbi:MAG: S1/P1 nuclease [Hyphomicrobiales bacterium]|nr:S1/P1 nuclease [Hyphomicrobiales bacterium]